MVASFDAIGHSCLRDCAANKFHLSFDTVTCMLEPCTQDKKDKAREAMRDLLSEQRYRETMCDRISTLNPKLRLGDIT